MKTQPVNYDLLLFLQKDLDALVQRSWNIYEKEKAKTKEQVWQEHQDSLTRVLETWANHKKNAERSGVVYE